jgi:hypothetical protein
MPFHCNSWTANLLRCQMLVWSNSPKLSELWTGCQAWFTSMIVPLIIYCKASVLLPCFDSSNVTRCYLFPFLNFSFWEYLDLGLSQVVLWCGYFAQVLVFLTIMCGMRKFWLDRSYKQILMHKSTVEFRKCDHIPVWSYILTDVMTLENGRRPCRLFISPLG